MSKKKIIVNIVAVVAVICAIVLLSSSVFAKGDTRNYKRIIGDSTIFSESEINSAMDVAVKHFKYHFDGCTLTEIAYDEEFSNKSADSRAENYNADKAIVLTSSFNTDDFAGEGSFNPNSTYTRWQWVLTKNGIGGWKLQTWGYG